MEREGTSSFGLATHQRCQTVEVTYRRSSCPSPTRVHCLSRVLSLLLIYCNSLCYSLYEGTKLDADDSSVDVELAVGPVTIASKKTKIGKEGKAVWYESILGEVRE